MASTPEQKTYNLITTSNVVAVVICLLIGLLPVTMMTELRGGSANFWALLIFSLIACTLRSGGVHASLQSLASYRVLTLALFVMPFTVFMASLWSHQLLGQDTERAIRVFIGTLTILAACLSLNPKWLRHSIWGFMAGVIGGTGNLIWVSWPHFTRPYMDQYTTVGFSNVLLLLTIMVLFSLGWKLTRFKRTELFIKITVVLVGIVGVIIAETRSSWFAIPFFLAIGLILIHKLFSIWRLILTGMFAVIVTAGAFYANPSLSARAKLAVNEYVDCRTITPIADTSVCIRIQLWRASWHMFKANPLLANAGSARFEEKLAELHKQGIVSKFTSEDFGEPHNDFFFALANYGLMGLIAFLLMYFVPALIFTMRMRVGFTQDIRVAAAMGLSVCAGFIAFGLTEAMFRSMRMLSFYVVLTSWLLALSHINHKKIISK